MRTDRFTLIKTVVTKSDGRALAHVEIDFHPTADTLGKQPPRCYIAGREVDAETLNTALMICWVFAPMSDAGGIRFTEETRPLEDTQKPDVNAGPLCG